MEWSENKTNNSEDNSGPDLSDIQRMIEDHLNRPADYGLPSATPIQTTTIQEPYIRIVEQPASRSLRFRYECEGRSAGSIPGVNATPENRTFPTIAIDDCPSDAVVVVIVSCVTHTPPYRPHPHELVGRDCKDGICRVELKADAEKRAVFSNLGIRCVKRKDIKKSLEIRERFNVNPFKTRFDHNDIDLNVVRLCFQAFLKHGSNRKPLKPVVSEPICDKKHGELRIYRLCSCEAKVDGGDEIILLCEKVAKDDVQIRFYEIDDKENIVWEEYAKFEPTDVHKQTAIAFRTPRYRSAEIKGNAKVYIQLVRPSDGKTSESLPFEYHPDPGMRMFSRIRRKLKHKEDLEIFAQILSLDSETTATKYSCPPTDFDIDNEDIDTVSTESSASKPLSASTLNEYDEGVKKQTESETDGGEEVEQVRSMEIELEVPQIQYPAADESTQTSTPMEEILRHQHLDGPRELSMVDKITEWMRSSEFERTDSLTVENGDSNSVTLTTAYTNVTNLTTNHTTVSMGTDEDKTFTDLMAQATGIDMESRRGTLDNPNLKDLPVGGLEASEMDLPEPVEVLMKKIHEGCASTQASVDLDETFDETATYTSLKKAYDNPLEMPHRMRDKVLSSGCVVNEEDGLIVLTNPPAPKIRVNSVQTPPSPPTPASPTLPPRTPSPVQDHKPPPLPPKRKSSDSSEPLSSASFERTRNGSIPSRPPSQIIIMRTPDQSPTKRQPTPTNSPKRKQSFFSRLFSRRKSKADLEPTNGANPKPPTIQKAASPTGSREPSIGHFSINDPNRSSIRSAKSLQAGSIAGNSPGLSPQSSVNAAKGGKPVGRSLSSVSGKRPTHLNPDVIHIPLKGDSSKSLPYQNANAITFGNTLDRKTLSALQLADIPVCDGNMELIAIADRQSIKNLCEGDFGVILDPSVDLSEAEHFALYTSVPSTTQDPGTDGSTSSESMNRRSVTEQFETGQILSADEIARRLAEANNY